MTIAVALIVTFTVTAQEQTLEEVGINYYAYTENTLNNTVHQKGFYKDINGELKRDGNWKLYINGELKTEAVYTNDKLTTLVVDGVEYSAKDLYIFRLERKVEELIADNK